MAASEIYDVSAEPHGSAWLVYVPAIERIAYATHLADVERIARELVSIATGRPAASLEIIVHQWDARAGRYVDSGRRSE